MALCTRIRIFTGIRATTTSTRSYLTMDQESRNGFPQGLKPAFLAALSGTAEAVPFHTNHL